MNIAIIGGGPSGLFTAYYNALNGLKNALMDDPRYMRLYSIEGGNERIIDRLQDEIDSVSAGTSRTTIARLTTFGSQLRSNGRSGGSASRVRIS
jgi:2-polyprenyl-6-methoxyphenol hydroxylase-like FAD-dependent oxidoreductase